MHRAIASNLRKDPARLPARPPLPPDQAYRLLFEDSPIPMWVFDARTLQFLAVNNAAIKHYGYSRREFRSMTIKDIRPPEEVPHLLEALAGDTEALKRSRLWTYIKKDGSPIHAEVSTHKVVFDGRASFLVILHDVTEIRGLSEKILEVRDSERRHMARELHDSTVQILASLMLKLDHLSELASVSASPECRRMLADCHGLAEQCVSELRTLSYLLHPPNLEQFGLRHALISFVDGFSTRSGIKVDLKIPRSLGNLDRAQEKAIYRVLQESLINVQHHSDSHRARVRILRNPKEIAVQISDRGRGFGLPEKQKNKLGVGISGMRERVRQLGGRFQIVSSKRGTTVRAVIPLG